MYLNIKQKQALKKLNEFKDNGHSATLYYKNMFGSCNPILLTDIKILDTYISTDFGEKIYMFKLKFNNKIFDCYLNSVIGIK
jgi:hypothetical protein